MEDNQIISLFFQRSEQAIRETDTKYGRYCFHIAYNILSNREDAEESVSDTYLRAWNTIPPKRPALLAAFLGRITRSISIDRWRRRTADKRGGGEFPLCLQELEGCVSGESSIERQEIAKETLAMGDSIVPCQQGIIRSRSYFTENCQSWYFYRLNAGVLTQVDCLRYDADRSPENPWFHSADGTGQDCAMVPISELEFHGIMDSYKPLEMDMRSLSEYPLN